MKLVPLSSRTYRTFIMCPWKAHAYENLGFSRGSSSESELDFGVHHLLGQALRGRLTPEEALRSGTSIEAADIVVRALADDPIPLNAEQLVGQYVAIDERGRLVSTDPDDISEKAVAHGYLDRIVPNHGDDMVVVKWKTGQDNLDDAFERHLTAGLLARALFPDSHKVRFIRHHIPTGSCSYWVYSFDDGGSSVSVQGPRGRPSLLHDENGPMVAYLRAVLRQIEATQAKPAPGDHCANWNGLPCRFLAAECPLSAPVQEIMDQCIQPPWHGSSAETLRSIAVDPCFDIRSEHASWAWNGVLQLEHFVSQVKRRLKDWAKDNGPIHVGDDRYGWAEKTENVVDAVYALQYMLDRNLPLDTICKAVNISKTTIERLPKGFHHIRQALLATAVTERRGKPRFGLLQR